MLTLRTPHKPPAINTIGTWGGALFILAGAFVFLLSLANEARYPFTKKLASFVEHVQSYDLGNAIAVFLAVGGYVVEHWCARKASQTEKQMERVEAQSHKLLLPITVQFHAMWFGSLLGFVDKHLGDMLAQEKYRGMLELYRERVRKLSSNPLQDEASSLYQSESALMCWDVVFAHVDDKVKKPRVTSKHELPLALHEQIKGCDRESHLWKSYEAFIRHSFVPAVEAIAALIDENGHLMESVSPPRLMELFGTKGNGYGLSWTATPRMWFYSYFLAYSKSWREILAAWDGGNRDRMRPSVDFPVGIMAFNIEAQNIVADAEQRLLGMKQMHGQRSIRALWSQLAEHQSGDQEK